MPLRTGYAGASGEELQGLLRDPGGESLLKPIWGVKNKIGNNA